MQTQGDADFGRNNLLLTAKPEDVDLLKKHLKRVPMDRGMLLESPDQPIEQVYFPISGVGSMIAVGRNGRQIEVGLFGRDGMSGTAIVTRSGQSPHKTVAQVGGEALVIDSDRLIEALDQSPTLNRHLLRYTQSLAVQTAHTALSNGHAKLEERLARWLLLCHDRIDGDELTLTHEFLSIMLGVRRAGVTVGTHILEGKGIIRAQRGLITVLDRAGLERHANDSYGLPEEEYRRLIS